ncbi:MAG: winged helix DNA-binding protein [Desulfobacterales bacterium]|nr:winged helix DNA-binding protein [Desulfobacterales bacterium]
MKHEKLENIQKLILEFLPLLHQKFADVFHKSPDHRYPCSKNQNRTIMIIKKNSKITHTDLGRCLDMQKGSLTSLIDSLESMRLVHRETDPRDRRKTLLSLTDAGEAYVKLLLKELERHLHATFETTPIEVVETFEKNLGGLVGIMKRL